MKVVSRSQAGFDSWPAGWSACYRFWANARPLFEPGALPLSAFDCQSTSAVIKSADKVSNKPKRRRGRKAESIAGSCAPLQSPVHCIGLLFSWFSCINGKVPHSKSLRTHPSSHLWKPDESLPKSIRENPGQNVSGWKLCQSHIEVVQSTCSLQTGPQGAVQAFQCATDFSSFGSFRDADWSFFRTVCTYIDGSLRTLKSQWCCHYSGLDWWFTVKKTWRFYFLAVLVL